MSRSSFWWGMKVVGRRRAVQNRAERERVRERERAKGENGDRTRIARRG